MEAVLLRSSFSPALPRKKQRGGVQRTRNRHSSRHHPRGLPIFQDPRSWMWTLTHDANAPSEDQYANLVYILLRPPKTPCRDVARISSNTMKAGNIVHANIDNVTNKMEINNNVGGGVNSGSSCCSGTSVDLEKHKDKENNPSSVSHCGR